MANSGKFYLPRHPEDSLFFKVIEDNFDQFEHNFPQAYQARYGFWRPVIRNTIEKFRKCGDLRQGFARVRCKDCGDEMFVAYSCKQRSCCPSCDKKRAILLGLRLTTEVIEAVPHRQWVFTIPKRLRIFFRMDRSLLGKLSRCAYDTVCEIMHYEVGGDAFSAPDGGEVLPGMFAAIQTFGDLLNWHSHIHAIVTEGGYTENGCFVRIPYVNKKSALAIWEDHVLDMMQREKKIGLEAVAQIRSQKYSGFSIDNSVRIEAKDDEGIHRLASYIARCPLSLARMIGVGNDGSVVYRAGKADCIPYPTMGDEMLQKGIPRNFQTFKPLDFLAEVTQHIPNKGEHQIRFYGWYSNKGRGQRKKSEHDKAVIQQAVEVKTEKKFRTHWAALIRLIYEVDPLKCQKCGGEMKIVAFIEQESTVRDILQHSGLWREQKKRPLPKAMSPPPELVRNPKPEEYGDYSCSEFTESIPDYSVCEVPTWSE